MPDVRMPDGTIIRNVPEGTTRAQLMARVAKAKPSKVDAQAASLKAQRDRLHGQAGYKDLLTHGATFGLTDEVSGIGNVLMNAIKAPFSSKVDFDPKTAYAAGKQAEKMRLEDARRRTGGAGTAVELAGGFVGAGPSKALQAAPTLLGRVRQGARAGALAGGVGGFGYGEGTEGKAVSTALGAGFGGALGGALPIAGEVIANRASGLRRLLGRDPELPRRIISEAIEADANIPRAVGDVMTQAQRHGTPMMLADTGENVRGLLASVARRPGAARTLARDAVIARQEGQADRLAGVIARDLGSVSNPYQVADDLMAQARTRAAPLYEQAYSGPTPSPERIRALLNRPSTKGAMSRAYRIAAEEGRDPTKLGFVLDDAGEVKLTREPSMQTLDYLKRGLDDIIEARRDPLGRLRLDEEGRAINLTLRTLLSEMDRANPVYAQARAAYAGPASGKAALEKGLKALNKGADDISAQTANMTPYELELYRLGVRRAMSDLVAGKGDYADKVSALMGTPKKRQALERLFGGRGEFRQFIDTLGDERAAGLTYKSVATGSQTAERMAADELTGDTGLAETVMEAALRGGKDGIWTSVISALQKLRDVDRFGAGQAGEATRESIAALLTETDPAVLREFIDAATRASTMQAERAALGTQRAARIGREAGRLTGMGIGKLTDIPEQPVQ